MPGCQHFSTDAKKSLDRERPFSLALRVVSLFSCLSCLAPSVTRVAICVSRLLLDGLQKKERLLVVYLGMFRHPNHFVLAGANNRNVIITYRVLAAPVQANRDFFYIDCMTIYCKIPKISPSMYKPHLQKRTWISARKRISIPRKPYNFSLPRI